MSLGSGSGKNGGGNGFGGEIHRFRFGNVTMWDPEDSGGSASEEGAVVPACLFQFLHAKFFLGGGISAGPKCTPTSSASLDTDEFPFEGEHSTSPPAV